MRHQLRDYQEHFVAEMLDSIAEKPVGVLPTGGGKTTCGTTIIERLDLPTLWLTHRKELIEQAAQRLAHHDLCVGIIKSGVKPNYHAPVQVASVQTLVRRPKDRWPKSGLVVIDEGHHATAQSYVDVLSGYPNACVMGLTATPFRINGQGLGEVFGKIVTGATVSQLCDMGILHRPRVWCGKSPDMGKVSKVGGDYNKKQAKIKVNDLEITGDIVETWKLRASGARTVCFANDIEHSKAIVAAFVSAGVQAEHVDGTMHDGEREDILGRLGSGHTKIVSNVGVFTEGWDCPSLECGIIARPTASLGLHIQMIGRVIRSCDGKAGAIILDHAGNHHIHGLVTRPIEYSLDAKKSQKMESLGMRRCAKCGLYFELSDFKCPDCGWCLTREESQRRAAVVKGEGELVEFKDDYETRADAWRRIRVEQRAGLFSDDWCREMFKSKFGVLPVVVAGSLLDERDKSDANKRGVFNSLVMEGRRRHNKPTWAIDEFCRIFGHDPKPVSQLGAIQRRWDMLREKVAS